MKKLDKDMVLLIHQLLNEQSGGSVGVLDVKLLDSALESVFATYDGKDLYPTKEEKGARLGYALIKNHAFVDGNKRIGVHIMTLFLSLNGIDLYHTENEIVELGVEVATGETTYEQLLEWIQNHKK
ncbi:MAG: type II toxin-antitoxin system death-on-curing family toxin [Firmicutes bacterium]|nr:type II toxin-antitoxin system death-on-curing family toxin [Bacillota bacterium]